MALVRVNKSVLWSISIISKQRLSDKDRDFIADLISEEARTATESCSFILHDVVESKRYCNALIEGTKTALANLLLVIKDNLPYKIAYTRYGR